MQDVVTSFCPQLAEKARAEVDLSSPIGRLSRAQLDEVATKLANLLAR